MITYRKFNRFDRIVNRLDEPENFSKMNDKWTESLFTRCPFRNGLQLDKERAIPGKNFNSHSFKCC